MQANLENIILIAVQIKKNTFYMATFWETLFITERMFTIGYFI